MEEEVVFTCPRCRQRVSTMLDPSVTGQTLIQDCEVCCNPLEITYRVHDGKIDSFDVVEAQ